jgi:hypothetical protein
LNPEFLFGLSKHQHSPKLLNGDAVVEQSGDALQLCIP